MPGSRPGLPSSIPIYYCAPTALGRAHEGQGLSPAELAEDGRLLPALLSPFDSLIWRRDRAERLFGYRHVFELYVPAAKRRYGYYMLPFLLGDTAS